MPNAHAALQARERASVEDVAHHAVCLALVEAAAGAAGDDARRILAAVLQQREALIDLGRGGGARLCEEQGEDAAHGGRCE